MISKKNIIVIAMGCLAAAAMGTSVNAMGVFYLPVSQSLGVSTGQFGVHTTLMMLTMAFTGLALPKLLKKYSIVQLVSTGMILAASSTFLMGLSTNLYAFYALGIIKGIGIPFYSMIVIMPIVNNWITLNKGMYTSIIVSFSGLVGAFASYLFGEIIIMFGWQVGYFVAAASIIILCLPTLLFRVELTPDAHNEDSAASSKPTPFNKRTLRYFNFVVFAFLINFICGFVQYLPAYADSVGVAASIGVLMLSMAQMGNVSSKLLIGFVVDWIGSYKSTLVLIMLGLISTLLLYTGIASVFLVSSFVFGVIYASASVSIPLLTEHYFSKEHFVVAYATINMVMNIGSALSQSVYGFLYDFFGSYGSVLLIVGFLYIMTLVLVSMVNFSKQRA
jgi:MFS family permease